MKEAAKAAEEAELAAAQEESEPAQIAPEAVLPPPPPYQHGQRPGIRTGNINFVNNAIPETDSDEE
jgi:hypothetical protein